MRFGVENALELLAQYDLVADGSDNFPTRFLVSDAAYFAKKTLVSAAVGQFDGQISTYKPHLKNSAGEPYPTYRCFVGDLPARGSFPACEEAGVIGALPAIIGSMQAMEVLKELLGMGDGLAGRILMYDALAARFFETKLTWDPKNPLNGLDPSIRGIAATHYQEPT